MNKPLLGTMPEFRTTIENSHDLELKIIEVFESWDDFDEHGNGRLLDAEFYSQCAYEIRNLFTEFINQNYEFKGKGK